MQIDLFITKIYKTMKKVEKNSAFWKRMKKELLDKFQTCTKETNFEVVFDKAPNGEFEALKVFPGKHSNGVFYALNEIATFCEYNGLSNCAKVVTHNGGLCVCIRIW